MQIRLEVPKSEMRPPPLCEAISNNDYVRFVEKQYEEVSSACILATERRHFLPSVTFFQHFVFFTRTTLRYGSSIIGTLVTVGYLCNLC